MIERLRKRFVRIAMLSITIVMLILSLIVNVANFLATDSDLTEKLDMIYEDRRTIPADRGPAADNKGGPAGQDGTPGQRPEKPGSSPDQEPLFPIRYFYLRFDEEGNISSADLEHTAAITADETGEYVAVALAHGKGYGYYSNYKYCVKKHGGCYMAVFLDCYQELHAIKVVAVCSLLAVAVCLALVYVLVVFFSQKAIGPAVRSAERQKQFITDASHELKTPITVIATSLKVLEMEVGEQKWIDKCKAQTERLKDLVNSLVTLSRMDEEGPPFRFEPFPISDAVSEVAGSFQDLALSKDHELQISIARGLIYYGDEYAIRRLVSTLLDNAVKYAAAGAPIFFSLEKAKRGVVIRTSNECGTIDPDDLDKLFDRFYRPDKSRNTSTGGFGIGLSIARSIAEGHKGSIKAICPAENKIEFTVELK